MEAKVRNLTIALVISCLVSVASLSFGIVATVKGNDDKIKADVTVEEINEAESGDRTTAAQTYKATISPNPQLLTATDSGSTAIIKSVEHFKDDEDKSDRINIVLEFTNNRTEADSFDSFYNFAIDAYQNGIELSTVSSKGENKKYTAVQQGVTIECAIAYRLRDVNAPIELKIMDYSDDKNVLATYTITLSK